MFIITSLTCFNHYFINIFDYKFPEFETLCMFIFECCPLWFSVFHLKTILLCYIETARKQMTEWLWILALSISCKSSTDTALCPVGDLELCKAEVWSLLKHICLFMIISSYYNLPRFICLMKLAYSEKHACVMLSFYWLISHT